MRIHRVYTASALAVGQTIELDRSQHHYLKNVLRLKPGAAFFLFDGRSPTDYRATLQLDGKRARARIEAAIPLATESALDCTIVQGVGRADHIDWSIQKCSELGARRILLFNAARTQSPLRAAQAEKRLAHWHGVAVSACEQCGRALPPIIEFHAELGSAIESGAGDTRLLLDFSAPALATALPPAAAAVSILLGPEGGLDQAEIELARGNGFESVSLGPRVLRTETAAVAALALVQAALGDL